MNVGKGATKKPQAKRKPGRPLALTPAAIERVLALVRQGENYRPACRKVGVNYASLWQKRYTDKAVNDLCARATLLGTEANMELAEERLKGSTNKRISVDRELAHHYRWKAGKLLLAYGDRLKLEAGPLVGDKSWAGMNERERYEVSRRMAMLLAPGALAKAEKDAGERIAKGLLLPAKPAAPPEPRDINPRPSPAASDYVPPPRVPPFVPGADERGDG